METTREPYELMFRWIPAGLEDSQYAGTLQASCNFAYVTRDGETVVSWTPDQKGPFHIGADGIDIATVIPSLNTALALENSRVLAEVSEAIADRDAAIERATAAEALADPIRQELRVAQSALTTVTSERDAALQRIADMEAQAQAEREAAAAEAANRPIVVSRMQALLALYDAGLLDAVNEIISNADSRTRLAWETATDFSRNSPTINALWEGLGRTQGELDALFDVAGRIEV